MVVQVSPSSRLYWYSVMNDPPFDAATALLWFGPLLFLALGGWLAFGRFRRGEDADAAGEDAA